MFYVAFKNASKYFKGSTHFKRINALSRRRISEDNYTVTIGDVSKRVKEPLNPEFVPRGYLSKNLCQWELGYLRWLMQKDIMGQDVFLIGGPGPLRRRLALSYLEMMRLEAEYVTLTRDTTEADLKQRREIKDATSYYHDQAAVRAAVYGRTLILDGIEKAERNVLPVLNNLLENREMSLDDGRRLIPHQRYDALLQEVGPALESMPLLRVSPDFRVIALGLPCPPHQGQPLDPPLRSRFQARSLQQIPFQEVLELIQQKYPSVSRDVITRCLSVAYAIAAPDSKTLALPDYPVHLLDTVFRVLSLFPSTAPESILSLVYPHTSCLTSEGQIPVEEVLQTFDLMCPPPGLIDSFTYNDKIHEVSSTSQDNTVSVSMTVGGHRVKQDMLGGSLVPSEAPSSFMSVPVHQSALETLLQLHAADTDCCIVGPRGCGKSAILNEMARLLGYQTEPILLYQDMTSRDLTQQRATDSFGNTVWRAAPLLLAALHGRLAVLDGLHRLHSNTVAVLHRLVQDRELQLYDGSRLLHHEKFDSIQHELGLTGEQMQERKLMRIHPAFRIVALAEPPELSNAQGQWMRPEAIALMPWLEVKQLPVKQMKALLTQLVKPERSSTSVHIDKLVDLAQAVSSVDSGGTLSSLGQSLSLRQLVRIAKRLDQYPGQLSLHQLVQDACLARFLPPLIKQALDETLEKVNIVASSAAPQSGLLSVLTPSLSNRPLHPPTGKQDLECTIDGDTVTIGNTSAPRYKPASTSKVPQTLFFDIHQHVEVMEGLLQDWLLGEHLLLIGNQGVGKNKLADRFLELLNRPREYLQLHRDSTVQSLTVQPCVKDGRLTHEDSPLVTAVREGSVLLLDEADKAPTHVTCVLKTLVESGEMLLSDGRRIVPPHHPLATSVIRDGLSHFPEEEAVIVSHPDFRMIVLANRPGFPFLGNDFFAVLGDLFSCHAIHNPMPSSEEALLASYGPDVPRPLLAKLVAAFGELRDLADSGKLQYPYSTREVVAVTKHLQRFPNDGVSAAIRNVLDFDSWSEDAKKTAMETLARHGLPVSESGPSSGLSTKVPLGPPTYVGRWRLGRQSGREVTRSSEAISYKGPAYVPKMHTELQPLDARSSVFSEHVCHYVLPLSDSALVTDIMTAVNKSSSSEENDEAADDLAIQLDGTRFKNRAQSSSLGHLKNPLSESLTSQETIFVASVAPLALYCVQPSLSLTRPLTTLSLHSTLPNLGASHQPRLRLWRGTGDMVGLYEQLTNTVLLADPISGEVLQLNKGSFLERLKLPLKQLAQQNVQYLSSSSDDALLVYSVGGASVNVIHPMLGRVETLNLPVRVLRVWGDDRGAWIVKDVEGNLWMIGGEIGFDQLVPFDVSSVQSDIAAVGRFSSEIFDCALGKSSSAGTETVRVAGVDSEEASEVSGGVIATDDHQTILLDRFPSEASGSVFAFDTRGSSSVFKRITKPKIKKSAVRKDIGRDCVVVPSSGQIVKVIDELPASAPELLHHVHASGFLEVTDTLTQSVSFLPVPHSHTVLSDYWQYTVGRRASNILLAAGERSLTSVDKTGGLRVWQIGGEGLQAGMAEWMTMVGDSGETRGQRLELKREAGDMSLNAPKHGKFDPKNAPHVGGNMWAGGTGGRDTAGLGGIGGPYRLDAGHDVFQVSDAVKGQVPIEVLEAARKMAKAAHKRRLEEIQMSEYDHDQYAAFSESVSAQVTQMRAVLQALTAKAGERWWVKRRPDGDLDDTALVDGLAGATNIYRQRREVPPEAGQPQIKPKRVRLLLDASGSMYRFNGFDQRLQRSLEAALMLMEACVGHEARLVYDIYAHSGEDYSVKLSALDSVPDNNKKRLDLLRTVLAHSQFCMSGDTTVPATKYAVEELAKNSQDYDQNFVVLLSDANLDRYGISPTRLATAMTAQKSVQCYAVFIGSLGDQAKRLTHALPAGRAYVCLDGAELPQIMQQIFTHAMTQ